MSKTSDASASTTVKDHVHAMLTRVLDKGDEPEAIALGAEALGLFMADVI